MNGLDKKESLSMKDWQPYFELEEHETIARSEYQLPVHQH